MTNLAVVPAACYLLSRLAGARPLFPLQVYAVKKVLGSGIEGTTWLCEQESTGELLACKMIKLPLPPDLMKASRLAGTVAAAVDVQWMPVRCKHTLDAGALQTHVWNAGTSSHCAHLTRCKAHMSTPIFVRP